MRVGQGEVWALYHPGEAGDLRVADGGVVQLEPTAGIAPVAPELD